MLKNFDLSMFDSLSICKAYFDHTGEYLNVEIHEDSLFEAYYEAMLGVFPDVSMHYNDYYNSQVWVFGSPQITAFVETCREISRISHVKLSDLPSIKQTMYDIGIILFAIGSFDFGWDFCFYSKKYRKFGHQPCIIFETGESFWGLESAVRHLLELRDYFDQALVRAKEKLSALSALSNLPKLEGQAA